MAPGAGKKKYLYKVAPPFMAFGMEKGSHVPHLYDARANKIKGFIPISEDPNYVPENTGYGDVSKQAVYSNKSEAVSAENFRKLADMSFKLYDKYQDDPEMAKFCYAVKDYITADGRAPQQKALTNMKLRYKNTRAILLNRINELSAQDLQDPNVRKAMDALTTMYESMNGFKDYIENSLNGKLTFDKNDPKVKQINDGAEPADAFTGKVGIWKKSNESLFPHEPSPNDIKQGVGLQDCFALSVLTQVAATNPDYIKNMLKDNDDGTVTVRFFDKTKKGFEPVYVTVNKTVNKTAFGQDNYANSSLWVQMVEKAYAKYNAQYGRISQNDTDFEKLQKGMGSMWRGNSDIFMEAVLGEDYVYTPLPLAACSRLYEKDSNGNFVNHPDYYLPEEEKLYQILDKTVNIDKKVITTMPEKETRHGRSPHDVGIRNGHIYTIRGVFEKDGKKFVQLRDPYGTFTAGYDKKGNLVNKANVFDVIGSTTKSGGDNMGTFNMELKDYLKYFDIAQGVPQSAATEIADINNTERNYDRDPLTPDEMLSKDNYDNVTFKQRSNLRKVQMNFMTKEQKLAFQASEDEIAKGNAQLKEALEQATAARDVEEATAMLNDPEKLATFAKQINEAYKDIKATDELYVLTNTKAFRDMRDSVKDLDSSLQKFQAGKLKSLTPEKLAESIRKVRNLSEKYTDAKATSIEKSFDVRDLHEETGKIISGKKVKIKTASERAFHRYTSAVSINNLCSYQKPLGVWPGKSLEAFSMYRTDLEKRIEMAKNGQQVKGNDIPEWKLQQLKKHMTKMQEKDAVHVSDVEAPNNPGVPSMSK